MLEIIQSGGPLMIPLIICGLLSVGLSVERFLVLNSLPDEEESKEELENLEKALLQEGQESAVQICENGKGALNFVFASLLKDSFISVTASKFAIFMSFFTFLSIPDLSVASVIISSISLISV